VKVEDERILRGTTPQGLGRRLKGEEFVDTDRRGKFMFVEVSSGGGLVLHFGMTGELQYYKRNGDAPAHRKVLFSFENGYALASICTRMLGQVGFTDEFDSFVDEKGLGPDALEGDIDADWFADQLENRRGMLKSALMNQRCIAGIGNVYADEVMYNAGLHPATHVANLSRKELKELFRVMRRVLGTVIRNDCDPDKLPKGFMLPHRDRDETCARCGGAFIKKTVAGRTSHICPTCQEQK